MTPDTREKLTARLARIEGQVRGLARMIEEDRYCVDVITQTQAVRAALTRVERIMLKDHVNNCVAEAAASGTPRKRKAKIEELVAVLDQAVKG